MKSRVEKETTVNSSSIFSFHNAGKRSAEHESEFTEGGDTRDNRVTNCRPELAFSLSSEK